MRKRVFIAVIILIAAAAGLINSIVTSANKPKDYVKVYYFHGDNRCQTCLTIEKYTTEAVEQYYEKELESGDVYLEIINFDKKKNKGFVDKYKLYNQALVMVRFANDKQVEWKDCPKIWETVGDRDKFFSYVKNEVRQYLKKK
ncbi:MAG: nitrophenyl compound nitroreductase subunit ArsF family protein [bacterium]